MADRWRRAALAGALVVALGGATLTGCSGRDDGPGGAAAAGDATTTTAVAADAITPERASDLVEAWRVDGQVGVTGRPAVRDGLVYFGNWAGSVQAVDLTTGEMRWQTQVAADNTVTIDGAALATDDLVYVADGDGKMYALHRATGELAWTQTLEPHPDVRIFSSPVLAPDAIDGKDVVIIGVASSELRRPIDDFTFRGSVVALDAASGEEVWRLPVSEGENGAGVSVWSSAAIDEERKLAFIGTGQAYEHPAGPLSDSLLAIDYGTGELEWSRQFTENDVWTYFSPPPKGPDADIGATPNLFTVDGRDLVGVGDKAGTYDVFDRETGDTVWARELTPGSPLGGVMVTAAYGAPGSGGPGDDEGTIYVTSNEMDPGQMTASNAESHRSMLFALDAGTGEVQWQQDMQGATFGSIAVADGVVYRPSVPGPLTALDARTGDVLWSAEPGGDMGAGVRVVDGYVLAPHGFWFFMATPTQLGGVVAYALDG